MPIQYVNPYRFGQSYLVPDPVIDVLDVSGAQTWTAPTWLAEGYDVEIECIGGGGNGGDGGADGGGGGGGGAYALITVTDIVPGDTYDLYVGGAAEDSWFDGTSLADCRVGAEGGDHGLDGDSGGTGGSGGLASNSVGDTKRNGGNGANQASDDGGGGGGAGGPDGAGTNASGTNGGAGNNNTNGGGTAGVGGASPSAGGAGSTWDDADPAYGPGGGGGGQTTTNGNGANGGLYGGGGGGAADGSGTGGVGRAGIVRITYSAIPHWDYVDPYNPDYMPASSPPSTGLVAWYDANTITGVLDGAAISAWNDVSGNGYHLAQGTGSRQPTFRANQVNGYPAVRFDGSDDRILRASTPDIAQPFTIIGVAKTSGGSSNRTFVSGAAGGSAPEISIDTDEQPYAWAGTKLGDGTTIQLQRDYFYVYEAGFDNTTNVPFVKVHGIQQGVSGITVNTGVIDGIVIGNWRDSSEFWNGDVAEVLFYDHILTETDRNTLYEYLASKYDLMVAKQIILDTTGDGTFQVPSDWNDGDNSIECIGAGGGGRDFNNNSNGGGGAAYARVDNVALTRGQLYDCHIGAGASATDGENTYFDGTSLSDCLVGAEGGKTNGTAGLAANSVGDVKFSGGAGGSAGSAHGGGGGGGAGGPIGQGGPGAAGVSGGGAGGGGGAERNVAPSAASGGTGGPGGRGPDALAADSGAAGSPATAGNNGGGGGGGNNQAGATSNAGGAGGKGQSFSRQQGSGGGGGGSGRRQDGGTTPGSNGGDGAYYGGGGGGAGKSDNATQGTPGAGGKGAIIIQYSPIYSAITADPPEIVPRITTIPATANVFMRFRADVGVTIDGNGRVQTWEDQSGNAHHLIRTGATDSTSNRPVYHASDSAIKNQPCVEFGHSPLISRITTAQDGVTLAQPFTIMVVARNDANVSAGFSYYGIGFSGNMCDSFSATGNRGGNIRWRGRGATSVDLANINAGTSLDGISGMDLGPYTPPWAHFFGVFNGSSSALYYLGAEEIVSNAGSNGIAGFGMGNTGTNYNGAGEEYDGRIAEVVVWNKVLTTAERQAAAAYINTRYGIPAYVAPRTGNNGNKPNGKGSVSCKNYPIYGAVRIGVASTGSVGGGGGGGCCMPLARGCLQRYGADVAGRGGSIWVGVGSA